MTLASPVTALYAGRLARANSATLASVAALWRKLFNPDAPGPSLAAIALRVGALVTIGQAGAVAESLTFLRGLTASATGAQLSQVAPFAVPPGLIGTGVSGAPIGPVAGLAPGLYAQRLREGWPPELAAGSARSWLDGLAASEPYRAANTTVTHNAATDTRLTERIDRVLEANACDWCKLISDRGYTRAHAGFAAHRFCRCVAAPEVRAPVRVPAPRQPEPEPVTREPRTGAKLLGFKGAPDEERAVNAALANSLEPFDAKLTRRVTVSRRGKAAFKGNLSSAQAYYQPGGGHKITIRDNLTSPEAELTAQQDVRRGWFSKAGADVSGLSRTVTHESGHYLHEMLGKRGLDIDPVSGLPTELTEQLASVGVDYGSGKPEAKKGLISGLSYYGATNPHETIAEGWAEYRLSPNPRPVAKVIGDYIVRQLAS